MADTDLVVANANGRLRLLMNHVVNQNHWMGLRLVTSLGSGGQPAGRPPEGGRYTNRDALGARVQVVRNGQPTLWRRARADGSYASANDPRVLVGLGTSTEQPRLTITWPSGRVESFAGVPIDEYTTLREGTGQP